MAIIFSGCLDSEKYLYSTFPERKDSVITITFRLAGDSAANMQHSIRTPLTAAHRCFRGKTAQEERKG